MRLLTGVFGGRDRGEPLLARIATQRLVLRPLRPDDREAIAGHLSDLAVARWLVRVPHPFRLADADAFIEQAGTTAIAHNALTLAVTLADDPADRLVGIVALHSLEGMPEFGYWLGRTYWGRGLMGEAVEAALAWAYDHLPVDEVRAGAFAGNAASLAIQERQGFIVSGWSRKLSLAEGVVLDHVDTLLTRSAHARRPKRPPRPA